MFSINIYLRFALIAFCLVAGVATSILYGVGYGILFLIIGIILLVGYILLGTVQSAAALVEKQQFDKAEKRLNLTFKPNWLYSVNRAYFYLTKGMLCFHLKRNEEGEQYLQKARDIGLQSDNEKAMVALQLANINGSRGKWNAAKLQMRAIKDLKVTEPQLKDQIKQFEKAMTNRGLMNAGRKGQVFQAGGKRRRPKMR